MCQTIGYTEEGYREVDATLASLLLETIWEPLSRGVEVGYVQCPVCLVLGRVVEGHDCVPDQDECFWNHLT